MKKALNIAIDVILLFIILDALILFAGLGQIAIEGRTGYWNSFWMAQAKFIVSLLQ